MVGNHSDLFIHFLLEVAVDNFFITESNKIKVFECLDSISIKELYSRNLSLNTEHLIEACHIYVLGMSIGVEGTFSDQTFKNIYDSVQLVSLGIKYLPLVMLSIL